jgi:DHA3 family tetracycline resistance protein-like MFS transporter
MPESGFEPTPMSERDTWQKMGATLRNGMGAIQERPLLVTILGIALIYGLYSEALDRLWEAHILENITLPTIGNLENVVWFGLINASTMIITIGTTELMRRRAETFGHKRMVKILALFTLTISVGLILFGLAGGFMTALLAYSTVAIVRRTSQPLYSAWVNRGIPSQVRATVLSTYGQMDAMGQTVGGPFIGFVAKQFGLRAAIVLAGILLMPNLALYKRAYGQKRSEMNTSPVET